MFLMVQLNYPRRSHFPFFESVTSEVTCAFFIILRLFMYIVQSYRILNACTFPEQMIPRKSWVTGDEQKKRDYKSNMHCAGKLMINPQTFGRNDGRESQTENLSQ